MHGVRRVKQTAEEREARRQRELSKIEEFNKLTQSVLDLKKAKTWTREAFALTTRLLQINPEFYTIWNYRRSILLRGTFTNATPEQVYKVLADELSMTMSALKSHPKVYWIWNHRQWCLEQIPDGPPADPEADPKDSTTATTKGASASWKQTAWERELYVVEKMLDADPRNFHAWGYRRYALAGMPQRKPESAELEYTERKISANFSNFSAWHQRSKTLSSLWAQGKLDESKSRENEFDLLRNAMYTDPNDQSVWMYHRWLVGTDGSKDLLEREVLAIQELLDEQPDSKWCMESMVHYKRMLIKKSRSQEEADALVSECVELLQRLVELDPFRRARYLDLAEQTRNTGKDR